MIPVFTDFSQEYAEIELLLQALAVEPSMEPKDIETTELRQGHL